MGASLTTVLGGTADDDLAGAREGATLEALLAEEEQRDLAEALSRPGLLEADLAVELDLAIPGGMLAAVGASDLTIEMDLDLDSGATVSETAITVEQGPNDLPLSGQGTARLNVSGQEKLLSIFATIEYPCSIG